MTDRNIIEPIHERIDETPKLAQNNDDRARPCSESGSDNRFGTLTYQVVNGQKRLPLPEDISLPVLRDLQAALLAGQEFSVGVVLDWSGVSRCDVFFYQMVLAARRSYARHSRSLSSVGPLPQDLRASCLTQGFEVDDSNGLLPQP